MIICPITNLALIQIPVTLFIMKISFFGKRIPIKRAPQQHLFAHPVHFIPISSLPKTDSWTIRLNG